MFRRFILWISHLWGLLCEFIMPSTPNSQTSSTSAPNAMTSTTDSHRQSTQYDVFLSFRGSDTRLTFTGHLYDKLHSNGISTFKDDPELRGGEVISDALLDAIRKSKAYIVVLSENYAFSSWCLDELAEILNCHNTMQRCVIPVFFNIDPSVVRHQTGSFQKAFKKHQKRFRGEIEKLKNWQLTLKQVADFSGHHISKDRCEADVINEIVDDLLLKINPKTLDVAKYPVGLDSRVEAITRMLSSDKKGVIKFGIYGMGGVGKTTLAKALFNQLLGGGSFKGSCFLANVRETSETAKGLVFLQQKLINDVLKSKKIIEVGSVEEGAKLIRERIGSLRILVLIDDIYDLEQYESLAGPFASGSVVIITTRDEEMLDKVSLEAKYRYMLNVLDKAHSRELFTQYAFEKAKEPENLLALSEDILGLAGGLPLALKIFGSYLSTKKEKGWKSYIETLQQFPNRTIEQKLVISLDALDLDDRMLKKIFLDIACFFIGWNQEEALEVLGTYYSHADEKIDTLKKRCLLTMNEEEQLDMHDLLRDMGRNVARNKAPDDPGKYSRLWLPEDIEDVLNNYKGTEAIEGIVIPYIPYDPHKFYNEDELKEKSFPTETFKQMRKLRFLYVRGFNLTGSFEQMFKDLRVLRWDRCPLQCLPSDFYPEKLVILELRQNSMKTLWDPNMSLLQVSLVFGKLKTLNMSRSQDFNTTPDFAKLPCLEKLNLDYCKSLEEVHISIGSLGRLDSLNLQGCKKLRSLPDTICNLRALKVLNISKCSSLEALPLQLGNIKSLTKLKANKISVSNLPDSIGHLTKLVELLLKNNRKLETLPDSICNLRSLEIFNISGCSSLEALPLQLGNIKSLTKLKATEISVSNLPDSIGHLTKLVELLLNNNKKLETLPDSICNLRSLEILNIAGCISLEALPTEIGNIESLKEIFVGKLTVSKLPDMIGSLTKLVNLDLSRNMSLKILPDTICNLRSLEILNIRGCVRLETLPDELWKLTGLRTLDANGAELLKKLPDIGSSQIALSLQELDLSWSGITALPSGFSQLSNLQSLDISYCCNLPSIPKLPISNLKRIDAQGCRALERLPNLSNLKHLEELEMYSCRALTYIQGLEDLISIKSLHLGGSNGLTILHLTKRLFKVYSEFGRQISVSAGEVDSLDQKSGPQWPDWIFESPYWTRGEYSESTNLTSLKYSESTYWTRYSESTYWTSGKFSEPTTWTSDKHSESTKLYAHLLPNESHNFMAIILCFQSSERFIYQFDFSLKNTTSGFIWSSDILSVSEFGSLMVIVPKSMFSVRDDDHRIEFIGYKNAHIFGIHLLYKTETKTIEDVVEKHVIDIDELKLIDPVLHHIFLDIACFFIGWKKKKVVQILETYYTNVHHYIDILKKTCLLKINDLDKLGMDDLHQYLGRKIACTNSLEEPEKHSRLWLPVDIFDVLKNHKGTEVIEGIVSRKVYNDDALTGESFNLETFKKMRNLRFLSLQKVHLTGSFVQIFQDLRWLYWDRCPLKCLPSEFHPPKLVILELCHSNIITMWELNMVSHVFENLKTLDMSGSEDLTTTPDFTKLPCLETLHLEGCKSLEEVHISIGSLVRLVSLDLHGCVKLRSLPDTICNLRALEVLDIRDCICLEALPTALGNIQSLRELNAGNLTVSILPDSTGQLDELVMLRLNRNKNLKTLPVTICNLRSLEILDISGCEKLDLSLDQLCTVTSLRELIAGGATLLKKFPHVESSQMTLSLQKLDFSQSAITALPSSISKLSNLEDLNVEDCACLLSIPELPSNLKWIRANRCILMGRLPNLSNLKHLEYLNLEDCWGLTEIQGLKGLTSIRTLHLEGCDSSLLTCIFTESLFQMYSEFGHPIQIRSAEFPDWISQSSEYESNELTMSLSLPPNVSHNYLGMILCIRSSDFTRYSVENTTSGFIWRGEFESYDDNSLMVIVPRLTFSVEDGDDGIKLRADRDAKPYGIHLLYKTEEYDSTTNEN